MPDLSTIVAVALAGLALSLTPGPSMLYVLSRSIGQSREAGLASALGLGLGGAILAAGSALGLAALFEAAGWIVPALRLAGAAYLAWLGVSMILETRHASANALDAVPVRPRPIGAIVRQGVLIEVMNPKTVLFFALFLPPFVDPAAGSVTAQLLVLGLLVPLTAIPSDLVVAWTGGTLARRLGRSTVAQRALGWIGGLLLLAIAANLFL